MKTEDKIEVTGVDLKKFVERAYELSRPQGMGILHFVEGPMPEGLADKIIDHYSKDSYLALSMDYVKGRAVKMTMWRDDGKLYINKDWFDHHPEDLRELLASVGMADKQQLVA